MFFKEDFQSYFKDLEGIFSRDIVLLTDILVEVSDQAIHSKLYAIFLDDSRIYEEIAAIGKKFEG